MRFILRYVKPYTIMVIIGFTIKFIGTIMDLFLPSLLAHMIDVIAPTENVKQIIFYGIVMLIVALIGFSFNVIANRMASAVARDSCEKIRHDLFKQTQLLSCKQLDEYTIASLEARLTSDTYNLHNFIARIQRIGVRAPILLVGGIVVTFFLDYALTLVLVATLPFIYFVVTFVSKKGIRLYRKLQRSVDDMVRVVRENALGIRVIKALSKTDYEIERFNNVNAELSKRDRKASIVMGASNPIISLLLNIGLCGVIVVGAIRVEHNLGGVGKIIAFMSYFTMISNAMMSVARIFMMTSKGLASAERIAIVVDTPGEIDGLLTEIKNDVQQADSDIGDNFSLEFKNVDFSYNNNKKTLTNIDFKIKKGSSLGIIGATGSGKTTIIALLLKFYAPDSGEILIDGKNIKDYDKKTFRSKFGIAMQNDFLFEGTLRENVDFHRQITDQQFDKALRTSQAYEFVNKLEEKEKYELTSKGTNLSGGQRQRLLIARALASCPEFLLLDDSSSALDYKTDALLRNAIKSEYGKKMTTIVVAQRVSSVKDSDLIIVLDEGKIVGKGTHDYLIKNCEQYKLISNSQMGEL